MVGTWKKGPGVALFQALESDLGSVPILAEDLGVITPDVVALRQAIAAPGMCVLQFAWGGGPTNTHLMHNIYENCFVYPGACVGVSERGAGGGGACCWDAAAGVLQGVCRCAAGTCLLGGEHVQCTRCLAPLQRLAAAALLLRLCLCPSAHRRPPPPAPLCQARTTTRRLWGGGRRGRSLRRRR